jgi:hypothetical protein
MNDTARTRLALVEELHTAVSLSVLGLGALQRLDLARDFYHLPLMLLAGGKERLLKVILCVHEHATNGTTRQRGASRN